MSFKFYFTQSKWSWQYWHHCYQPQRSCGQGNVFTGACDSVHRGRGVCLSACWNTTHPPGSRHPTKQTPRSRHPREQTHTPPEQTPPGSRHPPFKSRLRHTVNERPVRILLECILVLWIRSWKTLMSVKISEMGLSNTMAWSGFA